MQQKSTVTSAQRDRARWRGLIAWPSTPASSALPGALAAAIVALLLLIDHVPRFYQGDSIAYLTTGMNGWVPPDRSWAYGYGARWLVAAAHATAALVAVQAGLLLGAIVLLARCVPTDRPWWRAAVPLFAAVAALDPLNEAYARFWLSDTPAAAAFLAFVALLAASLAAPRRRLRLLLPLLAASVAVSVFIRVAYAPIEVGTLLIAALAASWIPRRDRTPGLRRRLLALAALPILAVGALAAANSQVAGPALRGQVFVNRMSGLYTMGVFLPALDREDFARAGVTLTPAEFEGLDLGRYDGRERQMWNDGPHYVRWLMQRKLGVEDVYDARFQGACAAVVRSALLHHPQSLAIAYLRSLALYFDPSEWTAGFSGEMGFGRPLPDWVASYLAWVTGRAVPPTITSWPSPLPTALGAVIGFYPVLLLLGAAAAGLVLARARPFGARHVVAAALLGSLLATPLFSHLVKPRYLLATATLCEAQLALTLLDAALAAAAQRLARRIAAAFRLAVTTPVLPAAVALLCIAAYAGQLGLGHWRADEFTLFINQRDWGWRILATRLLYAPRPFSEGLLFLYGELAMGLGRPLVVPFLATLWAGFLGAVALAARSALPPSPVRWPAALALAAAPLAFVLATGSVTEMFYWPAAAAAYLPTAGGAVALLFLLSRPPDRGRRLACGAALLVAATSSEVGAAFAVSFAGAAAVERVSRPEPHRAARAGWRSRLAGAVRDGAWWIVPGLVGVSAMAALLSLRAGIVELGADTQPYTGHAALSVAMASRRLALELLGGDGDAETPAAMLGALATRLLFALGFVLVWRGADRAGATPGRWQAVLAASLAAAALFSLAAAYYHYGAPCCERHGATRAWLLDLLAILVVAWAVAWAAARRLRVGGGQEGRRLALLPPLLLALSLFPVAFRIPGLLQDYDTQHLAISGLDRTWRSGMQAGTDRMEFYMPPDGEGMLVHGTSQPTGTFRTGPGAPAMVTEIGRFFGKEAVAVCQPWQSEKSWLIHGQFIPACPPHDGPPDVVIP